MSTDTRIDGCQSAIASIYRQLYDAHHELPYVIEERVPQEDERRQSDALDAEAIAEAEPYLAQLRDVMRYKGYALRELVFLPSGHFMGEVAGIERPSGLFAALVPADRQLRGQFENVIDNHIRRVDAAACGELIPWGELPGDAPEKRWAFIAKIIDGHRPGAE